MNEVHAYFHDYFHELFPSEDEARAFGEGLIFGDEPRWIIDNIEKKRNEWMVVFRERDDQT